MTNYLSEIKRIAAEMGYDIDTIYFSPDMDYIWNDYEDSGLTPYQAICQELGE